MSISNLGRKHLLVLVAACLWGCATETRHQLLTAIFDGVEDPAPASPPASEPEQVARFAALPLEAHLGPAPMGPHPDRELATYAALAGAMPKDGRGNLDWVQATEDGVIAPRPNIDPKVPEFPRLPMDIELDPGVPNFKVVFPHEPHTYWLHCSSCHPNIFEMKAGANDISMAKIFQGEFCGKCHGKVAFAPAKGCPRCHVQSGL